MVRLTALTMLLLRCGALVMVARAEEVPAESCQTSDYSDSAFPEDEVWATGICDSLGGERRWFLEGGCCRCTYV